MIRKSTILILLFSLVTAGLVASGVIHFRSAGVCFGLCEDKRMKDFDTYFPMWLSQQEECPDREVQHRLLLTSLFPDLIQRLDVKNEAFSALAIKEQAGIISLGEQEDYLSDPWRVILISANSTPSISSLVFQEEMPFNSVNSTIRACPESGFVKGRYCEGYVSIPMKLPYSFHLSKSSRLRGDRAYAHLRNSGKLDIMIAQMKTDTSRAYDLRRLAEEKVLQMPVSAFPDKSSLFYDLAIKSRQEEAYLALSCAKD